MTTAIDRLPGPVHICESCRTPIVFARTVATERGTGGKAMPLDAVPTDAGNVAVNIETPGHLRARVLAKGETHDVVSKVLAMPHFATCTRPRPSGRHG